VKFIHLSDTHLLGSCKESLYGIDPDFRLKVALQSIQNLHKDAKFIAITGDLANDSDIRVYEKLCHIADNFEIPIYPILGNHDNREFFISYFPKFSSGNFVQYVKKIENKIFIFLDTLMENKPYGELCQERLNWLKSVLDEYKQEQKFIFMHHHPVDCGLYDMDNMGAFQTKKLFWDMLSRYENIKHISFGHIHRIMHSNRGSISMHSTRSTAFEVAYKPNSKKEYLTNEESPTYAIININSDGDTRVHHHEYLDEDKVYLGVC